MRTRYHWLATTCGPEGCYLEIQYLGLVRATEPDGKVWYYVGRFVTLRGATRHDWMEPFESHGEEGTARAAYDRMLGEYEHAIPYAR